MNATAQYVIMIIAPMGTRTFMTPRCVYEGNQITPGFHLDIKEARIFHHPLIAHGHLQEWELDKFGAVVCEIAPGTL